MFNVNTFCHFKNISCGWRHVHVHYVTLYIYFVHFGQRKIELRSTLSSGILLIIKKQLHYRRRKDTEVFFKKINFMEICDFFTYHLIGIVRDEWDKVCLKLLKRRTTQVATIHNVWLHVQCSVCIVIIRNV